MPIQFLIIWLLLIIKTTNANKLKSFNCDYEIDSYNCVHINCKGLKELNEIPSNLNSLINATLKKNQILCSIDLSETGIQTIDSYSMENINEIYDQLISYNLDHNKNVIKILLSNIKSIESFKLTNTNIVLFIRDSFIRQVEPKSFKQSSTKIDLNLINTTMNGVNWLNLLDSTTFKLFTARNIPNLNSIFDERTFLFPITTITDLKIYNSNLPILEENFFIFKVLKYIEQIELTNCSISVIKDKIFNKITFSYLRMLSLANNNLSRINAQTFLGLNELIMLDLDENPIEIIEAKSFDSLKSLKSLSLNNNLKLIHLIKHVQFNNWFNGLIFGSNLMEISLKNGVWIQDFCLIQDIFLRLNKNLISNSLIDHDLKGNDLVDNRNINNINIRRLFLFNEDQIDTLINSANYCNIRFICANLKNLYWKLEVYNLCIRIKLKKSHQIDCLYYKMSYECSLNVLNSGSQASKYELISKNETLIDLNCLNPSKIYTKIKWISFLIFSVIIFLIILTLVFFYYSFKSNKNLYECNKDLKIKQQQQCAVVNNAKLSKSDKVSKQYDVNSDEYFVLLFNKK